VYFSEFYSKINVKNYWSVNKWKVNYLIKSTFKYFLEQVNGVMNMVYEKIPKYS